MRHIKQVAIAGGMLAGMALFTAQPVLAHGDEQGGAKTMNQKDMHHEAMEGHSHEMAEIHGGEVTMTPHHHFEALFTSDGMRLYVYDENQKPIAGFKDAKASVVLQTKNGKTKSVTLDYLPPDEKAGRTQPCFAAPYDFSTMKPGTMKAKFDVEGLAKEPIEFKTPVTMMHETSYTCSMHPEVQAEDPGQCPKCGMDLIPKEADTESDHGNMKMENMHHSHQDTDSEHGNR